MNEPKPITVDWTFDPTSFFGGIAFSALVLACLVFAGVLLRAQDRDSREREVRIERIEKGRAE